MDYRPLQWVDGNCVCRVHQFAAFIEEKFSKYFLNNFINNKIYYTIKYKNSYLKVIIVYQAVFEI